MHSFMHYIPNTQYTKKLRLLNPQLGKQQIWVIKVFQWCGALQKWTSDILLFYLLSENQTVWATNNDSLSNPNSDHFPHRSQTAMTRDSTSSDPAQTSPNTKNLLSDHQIRQWISKWKPPSRERLVQIYLYSHTNTGVSSWSCPLKSPSLQTQKNTCRGSRITGLYKARSPITY